jgi:quercetin dioxygenase-like cupin family protein
MKYSHYLLVLTVLISPCAKAAEPPPTEVIFIDDAEVSKAFFAGKALVSNDRYRVSASHRNKQGIAELHDNDTDIFYVVEGTATFVTGGSLVERRETGLGEHRGVKSEGGTEHELTKGDVIIVPKGTVHWFSKIDGEFLYYIIKVTE